MTKGTMTRMQRIANRMGRKRTNTTASDSSKNKRNGPRPENSNDQLNRSIMTSNCSSSSKLQPQPSFFDFDSFRSLAPYCQSRRFLHKDRLYQQKRDGDNHHNHPNKKDRDHNNQALLSQFGQDSKTRSDCRLFSHRIASLCWFQFF